MQALKDWLAGQGLGEQTVSILITIAAAVVVILVSIVANFVAKRLVLRGLQRIIVRSRTTWDDALLQRHVLERLSHLAPAIVIHVSAPLAFGEFPTVVATVETGATIYMVLVGLASFDALLNAGLDIYQGFEISKRIYLKSFVQVLKIVLYTVGIVFVFSSLLGKSPLVFFSGLGAFTAVLLLIFKDSILGLVAGVQLMTNNLVRRGDWIEMPKYGVDGDVLDVSLTTVTVQNWDKTIASIPAYALISDTFRNWRGMQESGGRRIKRSVIIDMSSIKFCDAEMLERFKRIQYIGEYIERKLQEIARHNREHDVDESLLVNGRHLTNVGTFRAYLEAYLHNHPMINQNLTFLVRHLEPTPQGLPIQIYVFSSDHRWAHYEAIQADIFDHILAVVPMFDLRAFQEPSGSDLQRLAASFARPGPTSPASTAR